MKKFAILLIMLSIPAFAISPKENAKSILDEMLKALENYKSASYNISCYERLKGANDLTISKSFTKINVSPLKLHIKIPDNVETETELIYIENENNNKIRVNKGKWIPTLKLHPFNSLIIKDQHHTIFSAGFSFLYKILLNAKQLSVNNFDSVFFYKGEIVFNGITCYKLELIDKSWKKNYYQSKNGETALSIGKKLFVPEYTIYEWNKNIESIVDEIKPTKLLIPSSYAKRVILYVDKRNFFPIHQEMYDDKGLFEKYEIFNLKINTNFSETDFKESF